MTEIKLQTEFRPTWLYIKVHNTTGLRYLGKTCESDPVKYKGSGLYWRYHIKKHRYDVTTYIIGYYTDKEDCRTVALWLSWYFDIVKSNDWANLVVEDGLNGGGYRTDEYKENQSQRMKSNNPMKKEYVRKKKSEYEISEYLEGRGSLYDINTNGKNPGKNPESMRKMVETRRNHPLGYHQGKLPMQTAEQREESSQRMKSNNPMRNEAVKQRKKDNAAKKLGFENDAVLTQYINDLYHTMAMTPSMIFDVLRVKKTSSLVTQRLRVEGL